MERPDPDALLAQEAFLRAIARPLVEDESQVDDVVQETWLKALEKPPRRRASLRSWLATVARNVALKTRRARTRRDRRERAAARPERDDIVMRVEGHQGIVDAVLGLAEPYRTMVLLRYYDRLTSDEIGARFGVTGAAVRKRLKRALVLLREALDERHGGNRRAWSVMLLPLLPKTEAAAAAAIAGGVVMGTKSKIGIAVVVVLLLVGGAWMLFKPSSHRTGERARPVATVPPAAEPATAPPTRPPDEAPLPEPVDFTAVDRDRDVHGVVVSSDGAPVAGARVETVVFPWRRIIGLHRHARFEERAGLETVTARDGTFALRFERGELVHVRVHADGYASRELPRVQAGERLRIVLAAPARLVVQLDPPVAGASVKLECTDRAGWWVFFRREGVTDDTGRCVFDDLAGGKGA
ncbi:MAG: sigma-70 family RNA polymerase sigma factor, partial [Planctomycetota bacterium]|nr:sigma-70 family RNA polymerase sigma factor [Planctomycetota bacterium]